MSQTAVTSPTYISLRDASESFGLSRDSLRRLISDGKLTAFRPLPGKLLISRAELERVLRDSTTTTTCTRGRRPSNRRSTRVETTAPVWPGNSPTLEV